MSTKKKALTAANDARGIDLRDIEVDANNGLSGLANYCLGTTQIRINDGASPRMIAIAAVEAAQLTLTDMAKRGQVDRSTAHAFHAVGEALGRLQIELRDLEAGAAPGMITAPVGKNNRRPDRTGVIERQAKALLAIGWLQRLEQNPLNKRDALAKVARTLRVTAKEIEGWMDTFRRKTSTRRKEALKDAWIAVEIDGQWVGGYERDPDSATADEVLAWLRSGTA